MGNCFDNALHAQWLEAAIQSGVPFHVKLAKAAGASRDEVVSALLIGLPAAGLGVTQVLPSALQAYDADGVVP